MKPVKTDPMTKAYVFAENAQGDTVLAGHLESEGTLGTFTYAASWLSESNGYPLDPVNLPLSPKTYRVANSKGVHPVFSDSGPDDWGTRILLMHNTSAPANELERLMRTSGGGVGCLRFSGSRARVLPPKPLPSMDRIAELVDIIDRAQGREVLTAEEFALIDPGSSMGGARPKVTAADADGKAWLIKLSRKGEPVSVPRLEYASMTFCREYLGIHTPECKLWDLGNDQCAFVIKRFDEHAHFISAYGLINQDRVREFADAKANPYSYLNLATILRKYAANFEEDCRELYRRMVANILLGNTDDHARNHAILFDIRAGKWMLSPAYDMLPSLNGTKGRQAFGVGKFGNASTLENALSYHNKFGLKEAEAKQIVEATQDAIAQHWNAHAQACGVWPSELQIINQFLVADAGQPK